MTDQPAPLTPELLAGQIEAGHVPMGIWTAARLLASENATLRAEVERLNKTYGPVPEGFERCEKCKTVTDDFDMWCSCGGDWEWTTEKYRGRINSLAKEAESFKQRIAALEAELDPAICRLQFPDGSVPGNAREAAEGWKRWYEAAVKGGRS